MMKIWIEEAVFFIEIKAFQHPSFTYTIIRNDIDLRKALVNVAKVYSSRANLEGALAELYVILPSAKIIEKIILDMLNEGFAKKRTISKTSLSQCDNEKDQSRYWRSGKSLSLIE